MFIDPSLASGMLLSMAGMDLFSAWNRRAAALATGLLMASSGLLGAIEVDVVKTNLTEHWITNMIEVRMPVNYYVNVFYTNRYQRIATNFVEITTTNWNLLTVTNPVVVEQFRTNFTEAYHTNWITLDLTNEVGVEALHTNFITHYRTNFHNLDRTNDLAVNAFHTNFVDRYRTNVKTLTLTNWEQVLVMKTNWIIQPITNVVQLDLVAKNSDVIESTPDKEPSPQISSPAPSLAASRAEGIEIRASLASTAGGAGQPEVQLRARWTADPSIALHVEQWRVEREDSVILLFGQGQEFRRQLPVGRYKVEVKVRREVNGSILAGSGVLDLSGTSATVQQKLLGQN